MSDADPVRQHPPAPTALSRRRFIAAASAAGAAAALDGSLATVARADAADPAGPRGGKSHAHADRPTCVATVSDASVVTSDDEGRLVAWNIGGAQVAGSKPFARRHKGKASYVSVATATRTAFTAGFDGTVILHNLDRPDDPNPPTFSHVTSTSKPEVWVVVPSRDGRRALSATNDGRILLWNTTGKRDTIRAFRYSGDPVAGLSFVPAGTGPERMFLSTHDGEINLWDVERPGAPVQTFSHGNSFHVNAVAVAPDGGTFVSGGFDMTVRVWALPREPRAGNGRPPQPLHVFRGHRSWVWRVAVGPENRVASGSEDGTALVWAPGSKDPFARFDTKPRGVKARRAAPGGVMGVAFAGNGLVYTGVLQGGMAPGGAGPVSVGKL